MSPWTCLPRTACGSMYTFAPGSPMKRNEASPGIVVSARVGTSMTTWSRSVHSMVEATAAPVVPAPTQGAEASSPRSAPASEARSTRLVVRLTVMSAWPADRTRRPSAAAMSSGGVPTAKTAVPSPTLTGVAPGVVRRLARKWTR